MVPYCNSISRQWIECTCLPGERRWMVVMADNDCDRVAPLPNQPRLHDLLRGSTSPTGSLAASVQFALAFLMAATTAVALGAPQLAVFTAQGASAMLFGGRTPYRVRWRIMIGAGAALVAIFAMAAAAGWVVGRLRLGGALPGLVETALLTAIGAAGAFAVTANRIAGPGAYFLIVSGAVGWVLVRTGTSVPMLVGSAVLGVGGALVSIAPGWLRDRTKPEREAVAAAVRALDEFAAAAKKFGRAATGRERADEALLLAGQAIRDSTPPDRQPNPALVNDLAAAYRRGAGAIDSLPQQAVTPPPYGPRIPRGACRLRRSMHRDSPATAALIRVAAACLASGGIAVALGLSRPHWAIFAAAVVVHEGLPRLQAVARGIHRFLGTLAGLALFACVSILLQRVEPLDSVIPTDLIPIAVVAALLLLTVWTAPQNYGISVVFVTTLALLVTETGDPAISLTALIGARAIETTIGIMVGIAILWMILPRAHRRQLLWADTRVAHAATALLTALHESPLTAAEVATLRTNLRFELVAAADCGITAATNEPTWTARHWSRHTELLRLGHDLLAACWREPPTHPFPNPQQWETAIRHAAP
ncbi:FUSC family protein [Nocardia sp. NPDC127526]|uniref:FUSC family protein n=1 Tax=Nocardia sp. NPDC127526 TaxID=3345393 RepID=UPI0036438A1E